MYKGRNYILWLINVGITASDSIILYVCNLNFTYFFSSQIFILNFFPPKVKKMEGEGK